jgi:SAM-dependent methyltransferase
VTDPTPPEAFFSRSHFDEWLGWIAANAATDESARVIQQWFAEEQALIRQELDELVAAKASGVRLLDVGCGFGRYVLNAVSSHVTLRAVGLDINAPLITRAEAAAVRAGLAGRVDFVLGDAGKLEPGALGRFDLVTCMANTFGNIPAAKRRSFLAQVDKVLEPGGRFLLSVYSPTAAPHRIHSYRAIGLTVAQAGDEVTADEGLLSGAFSLTELERHIASSRLVVRSGYELGDIGVCASAEHPDQPGPRRQPVGR